MGLFGRRVDGHAKVSAKVPLDKAENSGLDRVVGGASDGVGGLSRDGRHDPPRRFDDGQPYVPTSEDVQYRPEAIDMS